MTSPSPSLEHDPAAFWNGPAAERWVRMQPVLDPLVAPFGRAAMDAAQVRAGERVLDVGCGCGATSIELAQRVGPSGRVTGVDISGPMLAAARERVAAAALTQVELREGDAAALSYATPFDLVYSRFGWMFFVDPVGALAHLRSATVPGGRLALVTWRALAENDWARIPLEAIAPITGAPAPSPPGSPGPFAFADPDRIRDVLAGAGWAPITVVPFDREIPLGASLRGAVAHAMEMGPAARTLTDAGIADDPALPDRARAAIERALLPHVGPDQAVRLRGAAWIVTAGRA